MLNPVKKGKGEKYQENLFKYPNNLNDIRMIFGNEFEHLLKLPDDKKLFYSSMNLRLQDNLYYSIGGILHNLIKSEDVDNYYLLGLINFLIEEIGLRTSPMLLLAKIINRYVEMKKYYPDDEEVEHLYQIFKKYIPKWVKTPKMLSELLYTYKYAYNRKSIVEDLPKEIKDILKKVLERFDEHTLKNNLMRTRTIKLSDLIKVLKPKPKNEKYSELYKQIIENRLRRDEEDTLRLINKNDEESNKKVIQYIKEDKTKEKKFNVPINMLVRNLFTILERSEWDKEVISSSFMRINNLIDKDVRLLNVFDLFLPYRRISENSGVENYLNNSINKFIEKHNIEFKEDMVFIVDISGSMYMSKDNMKYALKYLSILLPIYIKKYNKSPKIFLFSVSEYELEKLPYYKRVEEYGVDFSKGEDRIIFDNLMNRLNSGYYIDKPYTLYKDLNKLFYETSYIDNLSSGTNLVESLMKIKSKTKSRNFVILSDEMSWMDNLFNRVMNALNWKPLRSDDSKLIIINIQNTVQLSPFHPQFENVLRITGLNPRILRFIELMKNWDKLKEEIVFRE